MVNRKRLDTSPVIGIPRLNAELDVRHPRRALTVDDFDLLLKAARESDISIQCYDGETRARIYTISYMTGLRKGELASLMPKSFKLSGSQPTVTVEAKSSKHRKKDILPLHPELISLLRDWTEGMPRNEPLFPKLAARKTWLMVKKDLEGAGIPYRTDEGIADFHAAGRHTHITELLRNGASLPEARELARHSDVRMTMRYTHISLDDQASALKSLPAPCQDIVRKSNSSGCHSLSSDVAQAMPSKREEDDQTPCDEGVCDSECPPVTLPDRDNEKWRRRGSNPRPAMLPRRPLRV